MVSPFHVHGLRQTRRERGSGTNGGIKLRASPRRTSPKGGTRQSPSNVASSLLSDPSIPLQFHGHHHHVPSMLEAPKAKRRDGDTMAFLRPTAAGRSSDPPDTFHSKALSRSRKCLPSDWPDEQVPDEPALFGGETATPYAQAYA